MSVLANLRATPTLLRVGFADAVAYRAEMLVWVLATTMPLVMLAVWHAVAADGPIGRYGQSELVAYFLATFIVRQLTSVWVFYEINFEVRNGTLAMRLLRPVHPLFAFATASLAAMPMRMLIALPASAIALAVAGAGQVTSDPAIWAAWCASIAGAWLISLFVNFIVGASALFMESSMKVMDVYLVLFFVLSGYVVPIGLFPPALAAIAGALPFRYQLGLSVELMTGVHGRAEALELLARQWAWVAVTFVLAAIAWRRGLRRFAAYGG